MKKLNLIIKNIKNYLYGEQPIKKYSIKLNTNENAFPTNINLIKNILKEIKFFGHILKIYPEPKCLKLKKWISIYYNTNINQIFLGNGSDEILAHIFFVFFKNNKVLYITNITYSFYESYIKLYNIKYKILHLNKNFSIKNYIYNKNIYNIILTNPNAPTGKYLNKFKLEIIIKNNKKSIILIDETYIDFEKKSIIKLINKYKNILIVQSYSKSKSLAGLRLGVVFSNNIYINYLEKIKNSFNTYPVDIITQNIIKQLYINKLYFEKLKLHIKYNKIFLIKYLIKLKFKIIKSKTNFILVYNKYVNTNILIKLLKKKNIFIRKFENTKLENFIRITIGKKEEIIKLIRYLKCFLLNII